MEIHATGKDNVVIINKMKQKEAKKSGALALSQIFILILGIFSIGYALGGSIPLVGAEDGDDEHADEAHARHREQGLRDVHFRPPHKFCVP